MTGTEDGGQYLKCLYVLVPGTKGMDDDQEKKTMNELLLTAMLAYGTCGGTF